MMSWWKGSIPLRNTRETVRIKLRMYIQCCMKSLHQGILMGFQSNNVYCECRPTASLQLPRVVYEDEGFHSSQKGIELSFCVWKFRIDDEFTEPNVTYGKNRNLGRCKCLFFFFQCFVSKMSPLRGKKLTPYRGQLKLLVASVKLYLLAGNM